MKKWLIFMAVILLVSCRSQEKSNQPVLGESKQNNDYLLYVGAWPSFVEGVSYSYFIDASNSFSDNKSELSIESLTGIKNESELVQIALDGKDALYSLYDSVNNTLSYQVIDIERKEVIWSIEPDKDGQENHLSFSPQLDSFITKKGEQLLFVDEKGNEKTIRITDDLDVQSIIWSPDGKKIAFIASQGDEKSICIYDIEASKVVHKIAIGKGKSVLTQWSETDKILFNYELSAFMVDAQGENILEIGKFIFYPMLSPDGKYLVYSRPGTFRYVDSLLEIDEYNDQNEFGIFVKDLQSGSVKKLPMKYDGFIMLDQIPIQWFKKISSVNYDDFKLTTIGQWVLSFPFNLTTSSYVENQTIDYSGGSAMDGDYSTAWVAKSKGNGLNEWLKITFIEFGSDWKEIEVSRNVSKISLSNGYLKSKDTYYNNNRIKRIKIEFSDGSTLVKELDDNMMGLQVVDFGRTIATSYLKIEVLDVYKGKKYNDTCISEIRIFAE